METRQRIKSKLVDLNKAIEDKFKRFGPQPDGEKNLVNAKLESMRKKFVEIDTNLDLTRRQTHIENILNGNVDKLKFIPMQNLKTPKALMLEQVCMLAFDDFDYLEKLFRPLFLS